MKTQVSQEKQVSCRVTNSVLKYVELLGYDTKPIVEGLPHSEEHLTDPFNWTTYAVRETVCQRAAELVHDETFMYQVGEAAPKLNPLGGIEHLVRLLGDPRLAYRSVPRYAGFFDKVFKFKVRFTGDNKAIISMSLTEDFPLSKHSCFYAQGILAAIPTIWGLPPAEVREKQCMCQPSKEQSAEGIEFGAKACVYEVTWQPIQAWYSKPIGELFRRGNKVSHAITELESNFQLLEEKNLELVRRNIQLGKVREIALNINKAKTVDEVLSSIVELSRDIPGVRFVVVQQPDERHEFITTPYYSGIRSEFVPKALKALGFDLDQQLGKTPTSRKLQLPVAKFKVAQDYLSNPRVIVKERLSELLDGIWGKTLCDSIQRVASAKRFVLVPLLIDGESWGAMTFFLEDDVPQDILEMVGAHCSTALKNVSTLQSLETALEGLAESEDKLRLTFESAAEGITVSDLQGNIVQVNEAALSMHGYETKEELVGRSSFELIAERDHARAIENLKKTLEKGHVRHIEYTFLTKDGREFDAELSASVIRDATGNPIGFVAVTEDITERKHVGHALRTQKELIDRILASTPNAVLVINRDLHIVLVNKTFCDTFNLKSADVESRHISDVISVVGLSEAISKVQANNEPEVQLEFRYKLATLERIMVASMIRMEEEEVLLILRDVTDERERLERLYLTDRLVSVGEMASGIAHELNNPLTGVIGFAELLMDRDLPDDVREEVETIHSEAQRTAAIVKNLLTFGRKHTPMRQLTQTNRIIEDVLRLRAYEHRVNNIQVNTRLDPELPEIMVDYYQMQQVFLNITLNAETAMIETHNQGNLNISTEKANNTIKVLFTDDGPGITEAILKRIFDPFFTTKEVGKGTGLGLSICHGIVSRHDGKIYARSEPGKGTTFVVKLPTNAH